MRNGSVYLTYNTGQFSDEICLGTVSEVCEAPASAPEATGHTLTRVIADLIYELTENADNNDRVTLTLEIR